MARPPPVLAWSKVQLRVWGNEWQGRDERMKFLPTITLDNATYEALRCGQLRLQRGQWVQIPGTPAGVKSKPSRFVAARPGWIDMVHPDGAFATGKVRMGVFQRRCEAQRRVA